MQMASIKLWNDGDSSLDHLHVFGCKAYIQMPLGLWSSKLAPRALERIYLGPAGETAHHHWILMVGINKVKLTWGRTLWSSEYASNRVSTNEWAAHWFIREEFTQRLSLRSQHWKTGTTSTPVAGLKYLEKDHYNGPREFDSMLIDWTLVQLWLLQVDKVSLEATRRQWPHQKLTSRS